MRAALVARVLRRAVLASLVSPTLVACGGASSPEGSGTSSGSSGGGSGSPSAGSLAGTRGATGLSTTGTATTGSGQSGSVTSGTAQTGANSGATSGGSSGSSPDSGSAGTGSGTGGSGSSGNGSIASGSLDGGLPNGCTFKPGQVGPTRPCVSWTFDLVGSASASACLSETCAEICGTSELSGCNGYDDSTGGHITCGFDCIQSSGTSGRRPEGLSDARATGPDAVARFLAQTAYLEAASVDAFDRLAFELEAHGAPEGLRAGARRAAQDEIRHARVTKNLAERAGARVPRVRVERRSVRPLEDIAIENAVEGCVRETYGAAVAMIQAERSGDVRIRRAMKRISRDESRHAELSWQVAQWLSPKLNAESRRRVREAQAKAVAALVRDARHEPDARLTERLGVPGASQASAVLAELQATLWSEPMAA